MLTATCSKQPIENRSQVDITYLSRHLHPSDTVPLPSGSRCADTNGNHHLLKFNQLFSSPQSIPISQIS